MGAFELYKTTYVNAKIAFDAAFNKHEKVVEGAKGLSVDPITDPQFQKYDAALWEAKLELFSAAEYLGGCLAQGAMAELDCDAEDCLITIQDDIDESAGDCYRFQVEMLVVPKIETWDEKDPELEDLAKKIKYGIFKMSEAESLLTKFGVAHGEVVTFDWISDNKLLSKSYEKWIVYLCAEAQKCINDYRLNRR